MTDPIVVHMPHSDEEVDKALATIVNCLSAIARRTAANETILRIAIRGQEVRLIGTSSLGIHNSMTYCADIDFTNWLTEFRSLYPGVKFDGEEYPT